MPSVVTAMLMFGGCVGEMVLPFIIGHFFDETPLWLGRVCGGAIVCMLVLLATSLAMMRLQHRRYQRAFKMTL